MEYTNMEDIKYMILARDSLERYYKSVDNLSDIRPEFKKIYYSILLYIKNNCNHVIIEDYIDICMESSNKIEYCKNCLTTI